MNLFSKDKGIVLSTLNAILIIWIIVAIVVNVSNLTNILIKDYQYTYEEYRLVTCDLKYQTETDCKNNYTLYNVDKKTQNVYYKRDIIVSLVNVILVSGVIVYLNKDKKLKK